FSQQPSPDERSEYADYDVTDDPRSGATHHQRCKDSGDETNHDPGEYPHCVRPRKRFFGLTVRYGKGFQLLRTITKKERSNESAPFQLREPVANVTSCTR